MRSNGLLRQTACACLWLAACGSARAALPADYNDGFVGHQVRIPRLPTPRDVRPDLNDALAVQMKCIIGMVNQPAALLGCQNGVMSGTAPIVVAGQKQCAAALQHRASLKIFIRALRLL